MSKFRKKIRNFARICYFLLRPKVLINRKIRYAKEIEDSEFVLPYIEMRITTRCNMRCKKCGHLIPYYGSKASDLTFEDFKVQFDNLINAVSHIDFFSLVGGETMLSKYIYEILEYVMACDKLSEIRIISNGKVLPPERLLRMISGTRVCLHFSIYPQNMDNYPKIISLCKEHNVKYHFYDSGDGKQIWYDFGKVKKYILPKRVMTYTSSFCYLGSAKQYCNGMLYLCPRINNAHERVF